MMINKTYPAENYTLSDFDFVLPIELIAQEPNDIRSNSRLLKVIDAINVRDDIFNNIVNEFQQGDVLVINDTKVMQARLFGNKMSGGRIEIFIERIRLDKSALCMIRANHSPKIGSKIIIAQKIATVTAREGIFFVITLLSGDWYELVENYGEIPLPPYIKRTATKNDLSRYQTVYANKIGAVAAPTAGLHFDNKILYKLKSKKVIITRVTLHVGAGTFLPIKSENLDNHKMHFELFTIPKETRDIINKAKEEKRRVTAVGTTSLRALESAAHNNRIILEDGDTNLFIRPGYKFEIVDRLITNFHLPKSSLMMLVSAFAGHQIIKNAYAHAIAKEYRFFSYGDAMLLTYKK